jgi:hypothetical protein
VLLLYKKRGDRAKQSYLSSNPKGRRLKLDDKHPQTIESWNNLIALYEAWNKLEKAEKWRENYKKQKL